jgi:hypothetical protein
MTLAARACQAAGTQGATRLVESRWGTLLRMPLAERQEANKLVRGISRARSRLEPGQRQAARSVSRREH